MGQLLSKCGRLKWQQKWRNGVDSTWHFKISESEVTRQMLKRKCDMQTQLNDERTKRIKLKCEVRKLQHTARQQSPSLVRIKCGQLENSMRGQLRKPGQNNIVDSSNTRVSKNEESDTCC